MRKLTLCACKLGEIHRGESESWNKCPPDDRLCRFFFFLLLLNQQNSLEKSIEESLLQTLHLNSVSFTQRFYQISVMFRIASSISTQDEPNEITEPEMEVEEAPTVDMCKNPYKDRKIHAVTQVTSRKWWGSRQPKWDVFQAPKTGWWFQIFLFSSLFGEDSHFD